MKKTALILLLAVSALLVLCSACGGGNSNTNLASVSETMAPTAEPTEEPTPTPEPSPTPKPSESPEASESPNPSESPESTANNSNSNANTNSNSTGNSNSNSAPADKKAAASGMIGSSVSDLISTVGSPNSSTYTESCLVIGAEDGILDYGDFVVATLRYTDGSEIITGVR